MIGECGTPQPSVLTMIRGGYDQRRLWPPRAGSSPSGRGARRARRRARVRRLRRRRRRVRRGRLGLVGLLGVVLVGTVGRGLVHLALAPGGAVVGVVEARSLEVDG